MKKITLLTVFALAVASGSFAQQRGGGISQQMLNDIQKAQQCSAADKALGNAIASNAIDNLAKNHAVQGAFDKHFSIETPKQNIHNQRSSGRCWMFSGFNVLRSEFARKHGDSLRV